MKTYFLLTLLFLFLGFPGFAQIDWVKLSTESPRTTLEEADKLYKKAIAENNHPEIIQALILQMKCKLLIDSDSFPEMLQKIETVLSQTTDHIQRSMLHCLLAELYIQYYHDYSITDADAPYDDNSMDIREWSECLFIRKIFQHTQAALENEEELQQVPVEVYKAALLIGKNSAIAYPTLFDFISHKSIGQLSYFTRSIDAYFKQYPFSNPALLYPVQEFDTLTIIPKPFDIKSNILTIFQHLLKFRSNEANRSALLIADLRRLAYARQIVKQSDSLYLKRLQQLNKEFKDSPYVVEVLYREALYWQSQTSLEDDSPNHEKILALCREGVQLHPDYERIGILQNLSTEIEEPILHMRFPESIYPGKKQPFQLIYKNLSNIHIQVRKIKETTADYYRNFNTNKKQTIGQWDYILPHSTHQQDTILYLPPVGQTGLYELVVTGDTLKADTGMFVCNHLYTGEQTVYNKTNFIIRDAMSGKPVKNAAITIYEHKRGSIYSDRKDRDFEPITTLYTDKNGLAIHTPAKDTYYEVTDKNNPNGDIVYHMHYGTGRPDSIPPVSAVLFTDRSLYRPGQEIYYNGITWTGNRDDAKILKNKKQEVKLISYYGDDVILEQTLFSNSWGSFSGALTIPPDILTGQYTLKTADTRVKIRIEEYKRPKFEITIDPQQTAYAFGDTITITGHIKTFSGIKLENTDITYSINRQARLEYRRGSQDIIRGTVPTDHKGEFKIKFMAARPENKNKNILYYYMLSITARDGKGESEVAWKNIPISSRPYELSVDMPEYINKNKPASVKIKTYNAQGYEIGEKVLYTISRLAPLSNIDQTYNPEKVQTEEIVYEGLSQNTPVTWTPDLSQWSSGAYLLSVKTDSIPEIAQKQIFYLYGDNDKHPPLLTYNWLIEEKTTCATGEEAIIRFGTSASDVYLLYELCADKKILERRFLKLSNENIVFKIPYEEKFGNHVCLNLSFVKNEKLFKNTIHIDKKRQDKKLLIETRTFRDKLSVGQDEHWELIVKTPQNKPAQAEIMAVMYDQALDKISPHSWPFSPFREYHPSFPYWTIGWNDSPRTLYLRYNMSYLTYPAWQYNSFNYYDLHDPFYSMEGGEKEAVLYAMGKLYTGKSEIQHAYLPVAPSPVIRQNFQETAFFYPRLTTDSLGISTIRFTVPDAITRWKFMALAHTCDMDYGFIQKAITTTKEFSISPNLPRFFRSGDSTVVKMTVSNLTSHSLQGEVSLELFHPATGEIIDRRQCDFSVMPDQNVTVGLGFIVPQNIDMIGCRTIAHTEKFSDGEQHLVAVLPDKVLLTESLPIHTTHTGKQIFTMQPVSSTKNDYRLTLELTANPVWYAVLALPSLQDPTDKTPINMATAFYTNTIAAAIAKANPQIITAIGNWKPKQDNSSFPTSQLTQNEEIKSIFLNATPWVTEAKDQTEQIQSLSHLFDSTQLSQLQNSALAKLQELQTGNGGWSWLPKGMPDRFITANILTIMAKTGAIAEYEYRETEKLMQIKALRYLDKQIITDWKQQKGKENINYEQLIYLYARSMYRDIPLGDALDAHKFYMQMVEKRWSSFSFYEKALAATVLSRYGWQETANRILNSLKEYATITPESGMFWANNRSETRVNSAIMTQVAIMEAFYGIQGNTPDIKRMKQWLLQQKQTQNWGNVPSTVDAIYALLLTGDKDLNTQEQLSVSVGEQIIPADKAGLGLGYIKTSIQARDITPGMNTVTINKQTTTPSWGALYLQYFENLSQIRKRNTPVINIEKQLWIEKTTETGKIRVPVSNNLKIGDKVIIRLIIRSERDMQYIHIKDLRAACFEPVQQLSGYQNAQGLSYYESNNDASTNIFISHLPKGTHSLEYSVRVNQSGNYQDGIATIQSLYAPEFTSYSTTQFLRIR